MIQATTGIQADEISFGSNHVLFVEGKEDSIDVTVLARILPIQVKPFGPSYNLKSAAEAFANVHPTYYFLIDRDHYSSEVVEKFWKNFPDTETPNLLIWRKKEIENYFLDSSFLCQSIYFDNKKQETDIQKNVIKNAKRFLYMAVANQVIISVREELKTNWINIFRNQDDFRDESTSLSMLLACKDFSAFPTEVAKKLTKEELQNRFKKYLLLMTDGEHDLKWDKGLWRDMIPGKAILHSVLGSNLFTVVDRKGKKLTGTEKESEIIKDLLSSKKKLPDDFSKLKKLLEERVAR